MNIYGTLGPACADEATLYRMFCCGMDGLRLNLSHRSLSQSEAWLNSAKNAARACGKKTQLLMDLQGPELRVGDIDQPIDLIEGECVPLSVLRLPGILVSLLTPGQELMLDDGKLLVKLISQDDARVVRGGVLRSRKSITAPGVSLSLPPLTEQDHENLRLAARMGITGVMQSFVRGREDLMFLRQTLDAYGGKHIQIFAKIENATGLRTLPQWYDLAEHVVIARGDLGNAVGLLKIPAVQKDIARFCNEKQKPFMVVTQLLASMEDTAVPTRAEVSDIFNAVLDGAAALMLTGETAAGKYPVEAMQMLCGAAKEAERYLCSGKELK